jgi:predicted nucleic acid-binding protein
MTTVADACPLIFLSKVRCLHLLENLFGPDIHVAISIRREMLNGIAAPAEAESLKRFLFGVSVERVAVAANRLTALSKADQETLALAAKRRADVLLTDDRLLREVARYEGIRPMGTLGILLRAVKAKQLAKQTAAAHIDALVGRHGMRLSATGYAAVLRELDGL